MHKGNEIHLYVKLQNLKNKHAQNPEDQRKYICKLKQAKYLVLSKHGSSS